MHYLCSILYICKRQRFNQPPRCSTRNAFNGQCATSLLAGQQPDGIIASDWRNHAIIRSRCPGLGMGHQLFCKYSTQHHTISHAISQLRNNQSGSSTFPTTTLARAQIQFSYLPIINEHFNGNESAFFSVCVLCCTQWCNYLTYTGLALTPSGGIEGRFASRPLSPPRPSTARVSGTIYECTCRIKMRIITANVRNHGNIPPK